MRVLVVEDDRALGLFLQKGLMLEGHTVQWASDGETALRLVRAQPPDLMVLDLGLPQRDGTEVLDAMREHLATTAVLVLTGRSGVQERVQCLDRGADDFMAKPFSFHELVARCRAILRRRERFADPVLRFGSLEMDRMQRKVRYHGEDMDLTAKEYQLLEAMMRRKGECCSRAELLEDVWSGSTEGGTNIVDVYITYLRKKLALAGPASHVMGSAIETVRGSGYRLRAERRLRDDAAAFGRRAGDLPMELALGA